MINVCSLKYSILSATRGIAMNGFIVPKIMNKSALFEWLHDFYQLGIWKIE